MKKVIFRILAPIGFLAVISAASAVVMLLWNWLVPAIIGWAVINFWQALGLLALCRLLFGGNSFGRGGMHGLFCRDVLHDEGMPKEDANHLRKHWSNMSREERRNFVRRRWSTGFGPLEAEVELTTKKRSNDSTEEKDKN